MKKRIFKIVLIVVMISITATAVACERENHGIPRGTYKPCVDGEIGEWEFEDCWHVYDEAEYCYNKFSVIEDEEGVWFYKYNDYDDTTWKFKAEYDKESKILTVYMPENFLHLNEGDEIKAYTFKRDRNGIF